MNNKYSMGYGMVIGAIAVMLFIFLIDWDNYLYRITAAAAAAAIGLKLMGR